MRTWLEFPNPVNEKTARTVAAMVLALALVALVTRSFWLLPVLCAGFALRAAFGPRVSPIALLASRVIAPRLGEPRYTPGPPKRFAQTLGFVMTAIGTAFWAVGNTQAAAVLLALVATAATLEAALGFCVGCLIFSGLMRARLIPERVCLACARGNDMATPA